ncbi:SMI1/KNR4 family protein [Streptomyces sp. NPDC015661]|uniref:SMI1/KNR4 family protein n=1 Tax=Streptomyces sp. NPDC015661 TaxID=3364961 RepID=UPI0036F89D4C
MHPAVQELTRLVPPPADHRPRAWDRTEERLGTALPQDYKDLVDTYGGGVFDETIWILEPGCTDEGYDLLAVVAERAEVLARLWGLGEPKPVELAADGSNVLPFAYIEGSGAYLYWLTGETAPPEEWTVLVNEGRGPEWEHHAVSAAEFVAGVLTGRIRSETLGAFEDTEHGFESNTDILGSDE